MEIQYTSKIKLAAGKILLTSSSSSFRGMCNDLAMVRKFDLFRFYTKIKETLRFICTRTCNRSNNNSVLYSTSEYVLV